MDHHIRRTELTAVRDATFDAALRIWQQAPFGDVESASRALIGLCDVTTPLYLATLAGDSPLASSVVPINDRDKRIKR